MGIGHGVVMHFHGGPHTPRAKLYELAGRCFCVSYADPRDVEVCHEIGQSVMLDNGAFTFWRQNKATDWPGFYRWAERWLEHWTTWAVIPDVIDGDEVQNDELINEWPFGTRGAPVFHLHESLDRLARLVYEWPLVCIGSSGAYKDVGNAAWHRRMAEVMDVVCDDLGRPTTRLHMLRGLDFAGGPFPFYSADSSNVAQNHKRNRHVTGKSIATLAAEIDARQTPARWHRMPVQPELEAAA